MESEDRESFDLEFAYDKGVQVKMTLEYPEGKGITAIHAISQAGKQNYLLGVMEALQDDPTVRQALYEMGYDTDEEDY